MPSPAARSLRHLLIIVMFVDCLPWDLGSQELRIYPSHRDDRYQEAGPVFAPFTSAAGAHSLGKGWQDIQPLFPGKKGSAGNIKSGQGWEVNQDEVKD